LQELATLHGIPSEKSFLKERDGFAVSFYYHNRAGGGSLPIGLNMRYLRSSAKTRARAGLATLGRHGTIKRRYASITILGAALPAPAAI
jgi:hypothetical protein